MRKDPRLKDDPGRARGAMASGGRSTRGRAASTQRSSPIEAARPPASSPRAPRWARPIDPNATTVGTRKNL